jgi:hypothetical protein
MSDIIYNTASKGMRIKFKLNCMTFLTLTLLWTLSMSRPLAWLWWDLSWAHFFSVIHLYDKPQLCLPVPWDFVCRLLPSGSWPPASCIMTLVSSLDKFPFLLSAGVVNLMRNLWSPDQYHDFVRLCHHIIAFMDFAWYMLAKQQLGNKTDTQAKILYCNWKL